MSHPHRENKSQTRGQPSSQIAGQFNAAGLGGLLNDSPPVLPGESRQAYQRGLESTILELGASTPVQVYFAEKIFDTLWWMRRYEQQKRALLMREMARVLCGRHVLPLGRFERDEPLSEQESVALEAMLANQFDDEGLEHLVPGSTHSVESLRQEAFQRKRGVLAELDAQIALLGKALNGFQASFEVLANRRRNVERIELQNALMRRDLEAIDLGATSVNESNKKKR